ncbi:hypothetical protein HanIR_Chr07g0324411 [Helianthus annuus]|nr:hypothetical protein HanIR_Chr07g0324411 [Helianthus annuus]
MSNIDSEIITKIVYEIKILTMLIHKNQPCTDRKSSYSNMAGRYCVLQLMMNKKSIDKL